MSTFDLVIDALLPEWPIIPPKRRPSVSVHCVRFVRRQIGVAPAHIRFGINILFMAFCLFAVIRFGMRPMGSVPREQRSAALKAFALEQLPPFVALERVLRSLTVVAFFDHTDVLTAIGEEPQP